MEERLLRIFQQQVELQCLALLRATDELHTLMTLHAKIKDPDYGTPPEFCALQNMLNAAANLSKALWGSGGKRAEQRKALRDSLGVDDSSPLREVDMRNNFEHFDERIDDWWQTSRDRNYVDRNIGIALPAVDDIDIFRNFIPQTAQLVFWGQSFDLKAIVDEAKRLYPLAAAGGAQLPRYKGPIQKA
jgi:hypothetical protein